MENVADNIDDQSNVEKEDAVRTALGVEKKFMVSLQIPIHGTAELNPLCVLALNEDDAFEKAKKLARANEMDHNNDYPEERNIDYEYDTCNNENTWTFEIEENTDI